MQVRHVYKTWFFFGTVFALTIGLILRLWRWTLRTICVDTDEKGGRDERTGKNKRTNLNDNPIRLVPWMVTRCVCAYVVFGRGIVCGG